MAKEKTKIQEIFPGLVIKTKTEKIGAKFAGKPISGNDFDLVTKTNDAGQEIYFIITDPKMQKAVLDLRTMKEPIDINSEEVLNMQKAASSWAQVDNGVLIYTPPPSENKDYIVCELAHDRNSDSFSIKKPDERAVIAGKGLTGRAIFAYHNENEDLVYIFANNSKFGGSLTTWGGKADILDLINTEGLVGKVLENKAIVNAAIRETKEEINTDQISSFIKKITPVNLERTQAAIEANGNTLNTATVVLYLGKAKASELQGILPTKNGLEEEIEGLVHIKESVLYGRQRTDHVSSEILFEISAEEFAALKIGDAIPDSILSAMSHISFESGFITEEVLAAIKIVFTRNFDNTALTSLQDEDNLARIFQAVERHSRAEEEHLEEKKDGDEENEEGGFGVEKNDCRIEDEMELAGAVAAEDLD